MHHSGVDIAHGLVLLFGIGTKALPAWDSRTRRNNLLVGLAVRLTAGSSGHANSPHPSSREGHHSTARWSSSVLLLRLILHGCHAAAAACSLVQRNSVPSTQMRCMITANRRASATIAFFIPRRLAICIAQALSQSANNRLERPARPCRFPSDAALRRPARFRTSRDSPSTSYYYAFRIQNWYMSAKIDGFSVSKVCQSARLVIVLSLGKRRRKFCSIPPGKSNPRNSSRF